MGKTLKICCTGAGVLDIDQLEPFQGSLKELSKKNYTKLRTAIEQYGFSFPIFVWRNGGHYWTLDGHQRIATLKLMRDDGWTIPALPVVWIDASDEKEAKHKLLLAVGAYGKVTDEGLYEFINLAGLDLPFLNETIELPDFNMEKFEAGFGVDSESDIPEAQETIAEELKKKHGIEIGQVWKLGDHKIICGSSADKVIVDKLLDGDKADLMFTDPPYGVSIGKKNEMLNSFQPYERNLTSIEADDLKPDDLYALLLQVMKNAKEVMNDSCSVFVCSPQGGELWMMMMMMMQESGLKVRHIINWVKNQSTFSMGRLDYDYQHEPILFTWNKSHKKIMAGQFKTTVWHVDKPREAKMHPTMKPIELPENAILNHTDNGDIVFEPFSGSGTTLLACEITKRKCRAIELSPGYVAVAIQRWIDMTGGVPELINGRK